MLRSVTYVDTLKNTTNLGNRTLNIVASDAASPSAPALATVAFDVAPQVVAVYVSGSAWKSAYLSTLAAAGVGGTTLGYELVSGGGQVTNANAVGWVNLDTVSIVFSEPVSGVELASLSLIDSSNNGGPSSGITVKGEATPSTTVVTFTLSGPLPSNKYYLALTAAGIVDTAGATLDGEWTTSVSTFAAGSGDGAPGGDFDFRFNVLAGDVNGDGKVTAADFNLLRSHSSPTIDTTTWRYDINGDGKITAADANACRSRSGFILANFPEPSPPESGHNLESLDTAAIVSPGTSASDCSNTSGAPASEASAVVSLNAAVPATTRASPVAGTNPTADCPVAATPTVAAPSAIAESPISIPPVVAQPLAVPDATSTVRVVCAALLTNDAAGGCGTVTTETPSPAPATAPESAAGVNGSDFPSLVATALPLPSTYEVLAASRTILNPVAAWAGRQAAARDAYFTAPANKPAASDIEHDSPGAWQALLAAPGCSNSRRAWRPKMRLPWAKR